MLPSNVFRRTTYVPALDGLRAVAVLVVLISHAWGKVLPGGWVGVEVFFVLSGYLITSILLAERDRTGRFCFGRFYRRRALRLLPALGAALVLAITLAAVTPLAATTNHQALATAVNVGNWRLASGADGGLLGHTWSLSIEEQFYLAWPILLFVLLRLGGRRLALGAALAGVGLILAERFVVDGSAAYFRTDTHGDGLLLGCAIALAAAEGAFARVSARVVAAWAAIGALLIAGAAAVVSAPSAAPPDLYTIIDLSAGAVVIAVVQRPGMVARALRWWPLSGWAGALTASTSTA